MRIAFLNPHGNISAESTYLGRNSDIGGQSVYVFELAYALAKNQIHVDIFTRQIFDGNLPGFSQKAETYLNGYLRILRLPFGTKGFIKKELIWPYIKDYIKGVIDFYQQEKQVCDFIGSHYADGGISAAVLSRVLNIEYSFTAHSLGIQKLVGLKGVTFEMVNQKYWLGLRIYAEKVAIKYALFNVISTNDERYNKYQNVIYQNVVNVNDDSKFSIIQPGINKLIFNENQLPDETAYKERLENSIKRDISRERRTLPYIISLSRLDKTKNHEAIIKAYGINENLMKSANLLIQIKGVENPFIDYSILDNDGKMIVDNMLRMVNKYQLQGKICFTNFETQREMAACYKYLRAFDSVFCLSSFYESFGIAYLEAMACGLPVLVTNRGGPPYILVDDQEEYGILIDPYDIEDVSQKLNQIINSQRLLTHYRNQGLKLVKNSFDWDMAAKKYLRAIENRLNMVNKKLDFACY